jgi:hypothetical protein
MSKRTIAILTVVLLLTGGVVGLAWAAHWRYRNVLIVENQSGQTIPLLQVRIGGETIDLANIVPGAEAKTTFRIRGDDSFQVDGRLADGTRIAGGFGYVTNGMAGEQARMVVLPEGKIKFQQGSTIPY